MEPDLNLAEIRSVFATAKGDIVTLTATPLSQRSDQTRSLGVFKIPPDCHAIDLYDRREQGTTVCEIVAGTEGLEENPTLPQMLYGVGAIFTRDNRTNLVCATTPDAHCYARITRKGFHPEPWTDLTADLDLVECVFIPEVEVFVACKRGDNTLAVLPLESAMDGKFGADRWKFVSVPGAQEVISLPSRIHSSRGVMIQIKSQKGESVVASYNLQDIGDEKITLEDNMLRPQRVSKYLRFRALLNGGVALVQNDSSTETFGLEPGITIVPASKLETIFGPPARRLIAAASASGSELTPTSLISR
ncbi:MAG: hypothetical protein Q7S48_01960 [bacterium]|nr:hypothetical protein [bacterium]